MMSLASGSGEHLQQHFGLNSRIIAAIDFGTSHSGYAMTHIADRSSNIHLQTSWLHQPARYSKNLTSICYKSDKSVESWGYTARRNYMNYMKGTDNSYRYFDRFKLYLDDRAAQKLPELPPDFTALKIIAAYLHNLYDKALADIRTMWGENMQPENIVWFLTVPAMWSEKAKQDMREAAVEAGLIAIKDKYNRNRINIVLEPEAAAMYCCDQSKQYLLKPGETFIIVDAGGGTIDLTAHEILHDPLTGVESLREITHGNGRSCGSTFIDEAFIQFMKVKCGSNNVDTFRALDPEPWLNILKYWEGIKREFEGESSYKECITIPPTLRQLMKRFRIAEAENDDDEFDVITITSEDFLAIFDPVVNETLDLIELQLERSCTALASYRGSRPSGQDNLCKIDKMFFVGGFAESKYLWKKATERFGSRVQMYRPPDAGSAVVTGAVLCGKFPRFIKTRCSRFAYGVKTTGLWTDDNPAGESAKIWNEVEQTAYAENLFHVMTDVDQQVDIDEIISTYFVPVKTSQEYVTLELYTTDLKNEKYMLSSMSLAATLQVPLSIIRVQFVQDVSASMEGEKLQASKAGLKQICRKLTKADEVGLIKFGSRVDIVSTIQPYTNELENQFNKLDTNGMTALYDAIDEGIRSLKRHAEISTQKAYQNVLLVLTDGEENTSETTIDQLRALLENPGIPNFLMLLSIAGRTEANSDLVKLCNSDECRGYCEVINVADSSDGIKKAYAEMDQKVKLFRAGQEQRSDVVRLDLRFGGTEVSADAVVEGTDVKMNVNIQFHAQSSICPI